MLAESSQRQERQQQRMFCQTLADSTYEEAHRELWFLTEPITQRGKVAELPSSRPQDHHVCPSVDARPHDGAYNLPVFGMR